MKRRQVASGLRYSILERDGFTCQYCGGKAPAVHLTVDHILPASAGGLTDPNNLVVACVDCNAGKAAKIPVGPVDNTILALKLDAMKERRKMLRATAKAERDAIKAGDKRVWNIACEWIEAFGRKPGPGGQWTIDQRFFQALRNLLESFDPSVLLAAVHSCAEKFRGGYLQDEQNSIKYFCGIMRNKRKEQKRGVTT
ncbi:MAG: HNH endonuclease [Chloroflexi bacterium]|nr:HNH endonuclease [Chloroflexota bacterium]MBE3119734.1 HNH endonuclease [Candidatus Atribacteria bacterium]